MVAAALAGVLYVAPFESFTHFTTPASNPSIQPVESRHDRGASQSHKETRSDNPVAASIPLVINWRERPGRTFAFPHGSPLENYTYYKSLAESGNGFAAYQLVNMMGACNRAFLTKDDLDAAIVQMRETFTYIEPTSGKTIRLGEPERVNQSIEVEVQRFESCREFTAEQRQEHKHKLKILSTTSTDMDFNR